MPQSQFCFGLFRLLADCLSPGALLAYASLLNAYQAQVYVAEA